MVMEMHNRDAPCDAFVIRNHFYLECDCKNDYEQYQRSLKRWREGYDLKRYPRPNNAENLFA